MKTVQHVLIFILTIQFARADLCQFVFQPNHSQLISDDLVLIGKLNKLDGMTNLARKMRTKGLDEDVYLMTKYRNEYKIIEGELYKGHTELAIRKWRTLFNKTERSALEAENYGQLIKNLNKAIQQNVNDYAAFFKQEGLPQYLINEHVYEIYKIGPEKYLKILHKRLRKHHRVLGNHFERYKFVRSNLDELLKSNSCGAVCKQSIKNLSDEIGITSQAQRDLHQNLIQNRKALPLKNIQKIFNEHPESIVIARRKEFISEAIALLKSYYNNIRLMRRVYVNLGNSLASKNNKLVRLFKRFFDRRAHGVHKGIIDKISHSPLDGQGKFELLKAESKMTDYQGLLVDFSRRSDIAAKEAWQEMKSYASSKPARKALLQDMQDAQSIGEKIGKISQSVPKDVTALITTLVVSGAFVSYMLYDTEKSEITDHDVEDDDPQTVVDVDDLGLDNASEDVETIVIRYKSSTDEELRLELFEILDTLSQNSENLSP